MIKILHIARPIAGVGVYISLLAKHIDNSLFKNFLICNEGENIIEVRNKSGNKIETFHVNIIRKINLINDLKSVFQIIKIIRKVNPDIIHCHSAKAGILGRIVGFFLKKKTFYTPHAYSYLSSDSRLKTIIFKNIERFFGFFPSKTLACSKSEYERAIFELKIKRSKVFIWENSIEDVSHLNLEKSEIIKGEYICSIGRPSYQKNTELLVKSILRIKKVKPEIHLVILGVGFYSPSLKKIESFILKNNLSKNITLIPWLDRKKSLSILKNSLLYVSTSRYEGLSYAAIEALSLGKPCVLTNVDGNKDLIKNNYNGFLVKESSLDVSEKILKIINSEKLLLNMSKNAKKKFENFYNIENNIKILEKLYLF